VSLVPRHADGTDEERPAATLLQEIREEAREQLREANAARWRAGALAEAIFGPGVVPRLRYGRSAAGFQAMVELQVPFRSLDLHRELEGRFLREVGRDDVLSRVRALFVFTPAGEVP